MTSCAIVAEINNPFDPWADTHAHYPEAGKTVWEWLKARHGPEFEQFDTPTVCYFQGKPLLRAKWDSTVMTPGSCTQFVKVVGDPVTIIIVTIAVVVAIVAVVLMLNMPVVPGGQPQPDPVFTRQGQFNRIRPGEPIEVNYGRLRMWPSYAARPYNSFQGNDQFQYNLFCLGQGFYDIEDVFIDDTPLSDFKEVEYEIIPPRGVMTMFPDNVETVVEVSNIELYGSNQAEYEEWTGPFVMNAPYTKANVLEVDMSYPQGLFKNRDGKLTNRSVSYAFEARQIDDNGDPIGDWFQLAERVAFADSFASAEEYRNYLKKIEAGLVEAPPEYVSATTLTDTRRTNVPQRLTRRFEVPPARYEMRGHRTSLKSGSSSVADMLQWTAARAFLPSVKEYGDVTLLAVKLRASNNINDNSRSRFNVVGTRLLPQWDPEVEIWSDVEVPFGMGLYPTRNPVDAFIDIFRAQYGGQMLDEFFDMDSLLEMRDLLDERGDCFDWTFDQRTTLFEAGQAVARVARAVPMLIGTSLTMVRDGPKSLPVTMFTPENIVKDSFRTELKLFEFDGYDCIKIQYVDPITWKDEEVLCALPGYTQNNPQVVKLPGCTDRTRAYREGMKMAADMLYTRENITFRTGLEGHLPMYGDLVAVSHDTLDLTSYAGLLLDMWTNGFGNTVFELSESVVFAIPELELEENPDTRDRVVVLRSKDGTVSGPYVVTPGERSCQVVTATNLEGAAHGTLTFTTDVSSGYVTIDGLNITFGTDIPVGDGLTAAEAAIALAAYINDNPNVYNLRADTNGAAMGVSYLDPGTGGNAVTTTSAVSGATWAMASLTGGTDLEPDFYFDYDHERPIYLFGVANRVYQTCKVVNIMPADDDTVELTCTPYNAIVHSFDELEPPAKGSPALPPIVPALPVVTGLTVTSDADNVLLLNIAWTPAYGAQYYVLEVSYDGTSWDELSSANVTGFQYLASAGDIWFRVAAVNTGAGPWDTWTGEIGVNGAVPAQPGSLALVSAWTGTEFELSWQPSAGSNGYTVYVYTGPGGTLLREVENGYTTSFTYDIGMADDDGTPQPSYYLEVVAGNPSGTSTPATITVTNPAPAAPTGLSSSLISGTNYTLNWADSAEPDLAGYRVYKSTTDGFTPAPGNLHYEGEDSDTTLDTAGVTTYWRAAVVDVWGNETLSAQQTI